MLLCPTLRVRGRCLLTSMQPLRPQLAAVRDHLKDKPVLGEDYLGQVRTEVAEDEEIPIDADGGEGEEPADS